MNKDGLRMGLSRRQALLAGAAGAAGVWLGGVRPARAQESTTTAAMSQSVEHSGTAYPPGQPHKDYTPVIVPDGATLPWKLVDGVKVFHLVAQEVEHEFCPGLRAKCWGYNNHVHGPVIEAVEGDRVRFFVTNKLPAATTVHWHGILVPNGMDGVGGLDQKAIPPGQTYVYEFTLRQHGTGMYHSHHDEMTQIGLGMVGMFVIHPRKPIGPRIDRDFAIMLHEWRIDPGASRPDPNEMTDFNVLTMNAKAFPGTSPLVAKLGEKIRIRFGNLSPMDHHPIHLHGFQFRITDTDGGHIAESAQWPETTVLVPVGSTRVIEFTADEPGDWAMHCHMSHHVMNQMGHGTPNMIGVDSGGVDSQVRRLLPAYMTMGQTGMGDMGDMHMPAPPNSVPMLGAPGPWDYITMGGMFTILKVRKGITDYSDPGWYTIPPGTQAVRATQEQLRASDIDI